MGGETPNTHGDAYILGVLIWSWLLLLNERQFSCLDELWVMSYGRCCCGRVSQMFLWMSGRFYTMPGTIRSWHCLETWTTTVIQPITPQSCVPEWDPRHGILLLIVNLCRLSSSVRSWLKTWIWLVQNLPFLFDLASDQAKSWAMMSDVYLKGTQSYWSTPWSLPGDLLSPPFYVQL